MYAGEALSVKLGGNKYVCVGPFSADEASTWSGNSISNGQEYFPISFGFPSFTLLPEPLLQAEIWNLDHLFLCSTASFSSRGTVLALVLLEGFLL